MASDILIGDKGQMEAPIEVVTVRKSEPSYRDMLNLILPLVMVLFAEALFFTGNPMACLWVHGLNIFMCLILLVLIGDDKGLFMAFALISLVRVLGLGMPIFFSLTVYNFIPIYTAVIVAALIVLGEGRPAREQLHRIWNQGMAAERKVIRKPLLALGLLVFGTFVGYLLANIEYLIIQPPALIPELTLLNVVILGFIMLFFVGFGEELIFRAILQRRMIGKMGEWLTVGSSIVLGIIVASIVFAAMHSIYLSLEYLAYVFIVGLILGNAYQITKSLGFVSLIHGSINIFLFSFLPYGYLRLF